MIESFSRSNEIKTICSGLCSKSSFRFIKRQLQRAIYKALNKQKTNSAIVVSNLAQQEPFEAETRTKSKARPKSFCCCRKAASCAGIVRYSMPRRLSGALTFSKRCESAEKRLRTLPMSLTRRLSGMCGCRTRIMHICTIWTGVCCAGGL